MNQVIDTTNKSTNSLPYIAGIELKLTYKCNRACGFCWVKDKKNSVSDLSLAQCKKILERFGALDSLSEIHLSGGEPLLYPYLDEVTDQIKHLQKSIIMHSNCDLLDTKKIRNIDSIITSIHSANENMDKFIEAKESVNKLVINTVCMSMNVDKLLEIFTLVEKIKPTAWIIGFPFIPYTDEKFIPNIEKLKKQVNYVLDIVFLKNILIIVNGMPLCWFKDKIPALEANRNMLVQSGIHGAQRLFFDSKGNSGFFVGHVLKLKKHTHCRDCKYHDMCGGAWPNSVMDGTTIPIK